MSTVVCSPALLARWIAALAIAALLLSSPTARADAPTPSDRVAAVDLRCEYLVDPLGVDAPMPRFSWKLKLQDPTERDVVQKAYRVRVTSGDADLWDSGWVESRQSHLVPYAGKPLASNQECAWTVQVKINGADGLSPVSKPARFTMGLLEPSDWSGKWIGAEQTFQQIAKLPPEGDYLCDPWLRKTFTLDAQPERATIHVASVGYHELYVNGKKVDDTVLAPCVSDHTHRARYVTYEIADLLRPGKNVIGLWLGTSWSVFPLYKTDDKPQTPIVLAEARIVSPNGAVKILATDETWKTHPSPNALLGKWMFMDYGGEYYDATRELPNWCAADLNDGDWKQATVYEPNLALSSEMVEPNRRVREIKPVAIETLNNGDFRVDMGVNYAGFFEIDLEGAPGDLVEFLHSEREEQPMTHKLHSAYRIGPSGQGTFANRFNYLSGRWIQIKGLKKKPSLDDVRGYVVRTDYDRVGQFECSDEMLNRIYETTLFTFENLTVGGYVVDCPQRERMGYGGDAHATIQTALNNYRLGAFYTKWLGDWRDVQGTPTAWGLADKSTIEGQGEEDGNIPYTAPTYWGGGGPAWSGICITMPWYVYRHEGDVRVLEENYPMMQRWLAFLETKQKDDMLVRWGGQWDFLGDWLWPGAKGVNGDTRETLFFNNCYWIYNLQTAAKIAELVGDNDAAKKYARRADEVRRAVHAEFYDPDSGGYVNNLQAYLAAALLVDLPPMELRPKLWDRFEKEILEVREGHFWGGITGGYFVVKCLLEENRADLLYVMATKQDYPGWGDMLNRGATTIWEDWPGEKSLLHSSYLHIGAFFNEGLGGIRPAGEGDAGYVVSPCIPPDGSLEWAKASYDSPYGEIRSEWKIDGDKVRMKVVVPPNARVVVLPPSPRKSNVPAGRLLGSGEYEFETAWPLK